MHSAARILEDEAARGCHRFGGTEQARRVGGVGLFAKLGVPMPADEAETYDRTVRSLIDRLGQHAFEVEHAGGRSAPLGDVVADALEFSGAVPA